MNTTVVFSHDISWESGARWSNDVQDPWNSQNEIGFEMSNHVEPTYSSGVLNKPVTVYFCIKLDQNVVKYHVLIYSSESILIPPQ